MLEEVEEVLLVVAQIQLDQEVVEEEEMVEKVQMEQQDQ